jgi:16S rRNA U1498 N3-methylase RsmE
MPKLRQANTVQFRAAGPEGGLSAREKNDIE